MLAVCIVVILVVFTLGDLAYTLKIVPASPPSAASPSGFVLSSSFSTTHPYGHTMGFVITDKNNLSRSCSFFTITLASAF